MTSLILLVVLAQSPPIPDKAPQAAIPSKTTPLASPQIQASPQQAAVPQYDQPAVVLRAVPQVYAVQRLVTVQAAPVAYATVAYDAGCAVQQQTVVQRSFVQHSSVVSHGVVQSAQVNHGFVGGVGRAARAPRKVVTKQVTKTKRGLFGLFGG